METKLRKLISKPRNLFLAVLIFLNVALFTVFVTGQSGEEFLNLLGFKAVKDFPEVHELEAWETTAFSDYESYFTDLARDKSARYAYEVMKVAPINPNIDMHLLGHAVGDVLYEQEGVSGIEICSHDFRNACSHSIVIGLFFDKGDAALPEIAEACASAPGGEGAYLMCFHGLGHGIFAYNGYDIPATVQMCEQTSSGSRTRSEGSECIGGMIMELIGGGGHDQQIWLKQREKYLSKADPLAPCSTTLIPESARYLCYVYLTPALFEAAGGSLANPTAEDFEKSFPFCERIPVGESQNRDACFGGFGKEFVGLVLGRDIRQGNLSSLGEPQMRQVYEWCLLADDPRGQGSCLNHALNSFYWGGENDRSVAQRFCAAMTDETHRSTCHQNLVVAVSTYVRDRGYRESFCAELPEQNQQFCRERLQVK